MSGKVEFYAEVKPWVCIKKQEIKEGSGKIDVSRALASIHESMNRKIWEYLKDDFDLEAIDKVAYEITGAEYNEKKKRWMLKGRKSEAQISAALAKLNSPLTTQKLGTTTKNGKEIAKAYLTRKVLDLLSFRIELDPKIVDKYIDEKAKLK